jgi:hypothetical protein
MDSGMKNTLTRRNLLEGVGALGVSLALPTGAVGSARADSRTDERATMTTCTIEFQGLCLAHLGTTGLRALLVKAKNHQSWLTVSTDDLEAELEDPDKEPTLKADAVFAMPNGDSYAAWSLGKKDVDFDFGGEENAAVKDKATHLPSVGAISGGKLLESLVEANKDSIVKLPVGGDLTSRLPECARLWKIGTSDVGQLIAERFVLQALPVKKVSFVVKGGSPVTLRPGPVRVFVSNLPIAITAFTGPYMHHFKKFYDFYEGGTPYVPKTEDDCPGASRSRSSRAQPCGIARV